MATLNTQDGVRWEDEIISVLRNITFENKDPQGYFQVDGGGETKALHH